MMCPLGITKTSLNVFALLIVHTFFERQGAILRELDLDIDMMLTLVGIRTLAPTCHYDDPMLLCYYVAREYVTLCTM